MDIKQQESCLLSQAQEAHAYNHTYSGDRDQKCYSLAAAVHEQQIMTGTRGCARQQWHSLFSEECI
jgi:hypothetical protein